MARTTMHSQTLYKSLINAIENLHTDESGVATTEYIIVFVLVTLGACMAMISTAMYIKAYRDFLVWWLAHPAV